MSNTRKAIREIAQILAAPALVLLSLVLWLPVTIILRVIVVLKYFRMGKEARQQGEPLPEMLRKISFWGAVSDVVGRLRRARVPGRE